MINQERNVANEYMLENLSPRSFPDEITCYNARKMGKLLEQAINKRSYPMANKHEKVLDFIRCWRHEN